VALRATHAPPSLRVAMCRQHGVCGLLHQSQRIAAAQLRQISAPIPSTYRARGKRDVCEKSSDPAPVGQRPDAAGLSDASRTRLPASTLSNVRLRAHAALCTEESSATVRLLGRGRRAAIAGRAKQAVCRTASHGSKRSDVTPRVACPLTPRLSATSGEESLAVMRSRTMHGHIDSLAILHVERYRKT
jgi:hypothetical protein